MDIPVKESQDDPNNLEWVNIFYNPEDNGAGDYEPPPIWNEDKETTYAQRDGKYMKQTGVTLPKV